MLRVLRLQHGLQNSQPHTAQCLLGPDPHGRGGNLSQRSKAGFADASRPIYGQLAIEWLREQLGAITYSEDGKLEAEVKDGPTDGYSLCAIRYLTKYHKWKVRNEAAEDVQYILWVEA